MALLDSSHGQASDVPGMEQPVGACLCVKKKDDLPRCTVGMTVIRAPAKASAKDLPACPLSCGFNGDDLAKHDA